MHGMWLQQFRSRPQQSAWDKGGGGQAASLSRSAPHVLGQPLNQLNGFRLQALRGRYAEVLRKSCLEARNHGLMACSSWQLGSNQKTNQIAWWSRFLGISWKMPWKPYIEWTGVSWFYVLKHVLDDHCSTLTPLTVLWIDMFFLHGRCCYVHPHFGNTMIACFVPLELKEPNIANCSLKPC